MSLISEIDALKASMGEKLPADVASAMGQASQALVASGAAGKALKAGALAPLFELPDAQGKLVRLDELLGRGPVVLVFYRGLWCPFCNLTLASLQRELGQIKAAGATLVAISPQTPEATSKTSEQLATEFAVLSDVGNNVARLYGLVFTLAENMRPIYSALGVDLPVANGDDNYELPLASTFIIDKDRRTAYAAVDADYTRRMEPAEITKVLLAL
ncbi:peroxiredoxin-like family protein [Collimonas silvisoli]|uniref:peroxiredoxin-like family protein n=1 Tax=Collimonas silvisoli TaxID=2825884 RepID=UPI001B8C87FF|nr:peroxiredoxin-like family protein [Collimonas silvisoli]